LRAERNAAQLDRLDIEARVGDRLVMASEQLERLASYLAR